MELPRPILQTLSVKSVITIADKNIEESPYLLISRLSFSHIIELIGEKDPINRVFYEVEAIKVHWIANCS